MTRAKHLAVIGILTAATASAGATAGDRPDLLCGGQTPFWSLEITGEAALFTAPDSADITYAIRLVTPAEGLPWPRALTLVAEQDTAIAILRPETCGDSAVGHALPWRVDVLTQRRAEAIMLTGCCRER